MFAPLNCSCFKVLHGKQLGHVLIRGIDLGKIKIMCRSNQPANELMRGRSKKLDAGEQMRSFNKKLLQQKKDRIIYDCNRFRCTGKLYRIDHNLVQSYSGEIKVMIHLNGKLQKDN